MSSMTIRQPAVGRWIWTTSLLAVLISHGWSIGLGWFQDDYFHLQNLRTMGNSFADAIDASRLKFVGESMQMWGHEGTELRFFRPLAFWLMKTVYTLGDWQAWPMHLVSIGVHWLCCICTGWIAWRMCRGILPAVAAACVMALHPVHVLTVYWIACQTELLSTLFVLLGVLAYARSVNWGNGVANETPQSWLFADRSEKASAERSGRFSGILAMLFYALALGCRESAIMMPAICWLGDRLIACPSRKYLRWQHIGLAGVAVAYFAIRAMMGLELTPPHRPYAIPPGDPEFLSHLVNKLIYGFIGLFGYIPHAPFGEATYFADRPNLFYGIAAATAWATAAFWAGTRFRRVMLWPLAWTVVCILPVLPVFTSPHHLYLPGVGMALFAGGCFAMIQGQFRYRNQPIPRRRQIIALTLLLLYFAGLDTLNWGSRFAYARGTLTEDILLEEVQQRSGPLKPGDQLFFINLPLLAYGVGPALMEETGTENLTSHVLTFSPWIIRMLASSTVEVVDAHTLRITSPPDAPYFNGVTGQTLLEVIGLHELPEVDQPIDAGLYTVVPKALTPDGITTVEFRFAKPLNSPEYHFFVGSPQSLAYPLPIPSSPRADTPRRATQPSL